MLTDKLDKYVKSKAQCKNVITADEKNEECYESWIEKIA